MFRADTNGASAGSRCKSRIKVEVVIKGDLGEERARLCKVKISPYSLKLMFRSISHFSFSSSCIFIYDCVVNGERARHKVSAFTSLRMA